MNIFIPYYQYIYLTIAICFLVPSLNNFSNGSTCTIRPQKQYNRMFVLVGLLVFLIGLRPVDRKFVDMMGYDELYRVLFGTVYEFDPNAENFIFDNLFMYFASNKIPENIFFLFMALIYFGFMAVACKKIFPQNPLIALCVYLTAFSTYSYSVNGIKAGAAASIFLFALSCTENKILMVLLMLVSWGVHHSMIMVLGAFTIAYFIKNTKLFYGIWIISLILSALHIGFFQDFFASIADESGSAYLRPTNSNVEHLTGFRYDFILYSSMPILLGFYIVYKKNVKSKVYELWLRLYLMTNSMWMLCMYANFTNRIAYLSWFLYPIVLIYPFYAMKINSTQYVVGRKIALYHLAFTLYMIIIYY